MLGGSSRLRSVHKVLVVNDLIKRVYFNEHHNEISRRLYTFPTDMTQRPQDLICDHSCHRAVRTMTIMVVVSTVILSVLLREYV